jgi:site-specific recombinase XerD
MTKQDNARSRADGSGPLLEHLVGFKEELTRSGYGPVRSGAHLELFADLCDWTMRQGLAPGELTSDRVAAFLDDRRARGHTDLVSVVGAAPLLGYLVRIGALPEQVLVVPDGPGRALLEAYRHYLEAERGLAASGVERYVKLASRFMASLEHDGVIDWPGVSARDVTGFLAASCSSGRAQHAPAVVPVLRSFLRFALLEGVIALPLHHTVPAVAGWRMSPLPQGISPEALRALLESCDRSSARGQRDFAILTLLCRLGLRAGEVTGMALEDLDWRRGELVVHGKARRDETLPLPADVGEAIATYLAEGRPEARSRSVFLRCYAPRRGLSVPAVSGIVYAACERAGIARIGAHCLRHTAASMMLAKGASLAEVGEVLRQRSQSSTAIYAKVERTRLATLARPWPGSER